MKYSLSKYPNYRIYSDGRVQNRTTKQFLTQYKHIQGYLYVSVKDVKGEWHNEYVHRLVAKVFKPNNKRNSKNRNICVSHINKNRSENTKKNVYHIEAIKGNYTENCRQAVIASRIVVKTWTHPIHGDFTGSLSELVRAFPEQNLKQPMLTQLLQGVNSRGTPVLQHKGWHLKGSLKNYDISFLGKNWVAQPKEKVHGINNKYLKEWFDKGVII